MAASSDSESAAHALYRAAHTHLTQRGYSNINARLNCAQPGDAERPREEKLNEMVGREAMRKATRSALQLFTAQPIGYACPKAPRSVRTPYAYRPLACRTYRVPYGAPQASSGRSSRSGSPRAPYATQGEPRTNRLGPRTNRAAAHTCGHCHAQAWQQRELMPMYFPMFVHCYIALVARSETETASRIIQ
eukprot:scaffold81682_cov37-Phaeocystis_antarctica.AAC.1